MLTGSQLPGLISRFSSLTFHLIPEQTWIALFLPGLNLLIVLIAIFIFMAEINELYLRNLVLVISEWM